ncbi:MAG: thiamine/thiamine pyrophosphate ABC transporter permease ThiP, partial [Alphaproteobacteria bacterium]
MARRAGALNTRRAFGRAPGVVALVFIAAFTGAALIGLFMAGGKQGFVGPWSYILGLIRISLIQAGLSMIASLVVGAAIAIALARRTHFLGRQFLISALNVATVLPAIVTVFAIVAVFGRSGWFGDIGRLLGIETGSWIFGLEGVLIAHLFLNAPLAARVYLAALASVGAEQWRLASQLGMPPRAVFRFIDFPVLLRESVGIGALIFLVCFTSFAIVLALGGGPAVSTLEVAIYEAVRFEADFRQAALLAMLQIGVCVALLAPLTFLLNHRPPEAMPSGLVAIRPDIGARSTKYLDRVVLAAAALFIVAPLAAILIAGLSSLGTLFDGRVARALATSLAIGIPAGFLSVGIAVALASLGRQLRLDAGRKRSADLIGTVALLILVVSPITLSAGLFVVLQPLVNPYAVAMPLIVIVNALMALPFTYRHIEPPLLLSGERFGRLADSLGVSRWTRFRLMDWPLLRSPLIVGVTMAIALSLGDLGVAAFFGTGDLVTLPLLLFERLSSYRLGEAASVSLLLTLLVLAMF